VVAVYRRRNGPARLLTSPDAAVRLAGTDALHLIRTLQSGQTFRWTSQAAGDGATVATGIVGHDVVRVRQDGRGLWLVAPAGAAARETLLRYFGFGREPNAIRRIETALETDPVLARVLPSTRGIAILSQDPWEVLVSFIISANNNIPKICLSVERLARAFGRPLGNGAYAFPSPGRLADARPRVLAACLLGYRVPYVRAAARLVAGGRIQLDALRRMPIADARERLLEIPGVGEKVADCVLLFGLQHTAAFPVDVWVQRAVERLYFRGRSRRPGEIRSFAEAQFGALAGFAQQHLFCYARARFRSNGERRHEPAVAGPAPAPPAEFTV
jgi:N-glycosylase/DNA lyase